MLVKIATLQTAEKFKQTWSIEKVVVTLFRERKGVFCENLCLKSVSIRLKNVTVHSQNKERVLMKGLFFISRTHVPPQPVFIRSLGLILMGPLSTHWYNLFAGLKSHLDETNFQIEAALKA